MDLIDDKENGGFSFIWTIENFSCCRPQYGSIDSPDFVVRKMGDMRWYLRLSPKGFLETGYMSCFLGLIQNNNRPSVVVNYALSLRVANGSFKKVQDKEFNSRGAMYQGFSCFLKLQELSKNGTGSYVVDDTLTLRCRFWKNRRDLETSVTCFARTKISSESILFVWTLKNFMNLPTETKSTTVQPMSSDITPFSVNLLSGETVGDSVTIQAAIKQKDTIKRNFLRCQISLLDSNKEVVHHVRDEHWFENFSGMQIWKLPIIPKTKLFANEKQYLQNGSLCLRCEFDVSSGIGLSEIERTEHGMDKYGKLDSSNHIITSCHPVSLNGCLQRLYEEGKFTDFSVQTPNKVFAVHKAILSARCAVFNAMFDRDMKENRTGVVEIEDLDEDTVSKMLLFIYTDMVKDLDCSTGVKLYFAADKYEIEVLKRKCSDFLTNIIDVSNACDILVLSDLHQDNDLKSMAREYIIDNANEIMISDDWKRLMQEKLSLASEIMHILITGKLKF